MQTPAPRNWMEVCQEMAIEKDSERLLRLADELNRLLAESHGKRPAKPDSEIPAAKALKAM